MSKPLAPPTFSSSRDFVSRTGDIDLWWPYVVEILDRHGLKEAGREPEPGFNATYPTFLYGDIVVKLFGCLTSSRKSHAAERSAYELLATDPGISAPRLLESGYLYDSGTEAWPYLVTTRVSGAASWSVELSYEQRLSLAGELGDQVRRIHALRPTAAVATDADWPAADATAAAEKSSLPPHLTAQVEDYLAGLVPFDDTFINSDLVANHIFVEDGRIVGIIDWGDAMVTDRHCELVQIYRDTFDCDRTLFRAFLEASGWPVGEDFPRKALGHALRRQAIGMVQHPTIDVFEPIAALLPLRDIATLDELANELFAV